MVLHAQGNLLLLLVGRDDVHIHGVAHLDHLGGVLDAAPGQLRDVDHTVHAADVYESAVGSQRLHGAGVALAVLDLGPDLLGGGGPLGTGDPADGAHHPAAGPVNLGDDQADLLLEQRAHGSLTGQTGLGGGDEHPHALDRHDHAALVVLGDEALHHGLVLPGGLDFLPALVDVQAALGQLDHAVPVADLHDDGLDLVAHLHDVLDLHGGIVAQLGQGNVAGVLDAQLHLDFGGRDGHNGAGNLISIIQSFERLLQHLLERFVHL